MWVKDNFKNVDYNYGMMKMTFKCIARYIDVRSWLRDRTCALDTGNVVTCPPAS